jgi:hypothetical protein
MSNIGVTHNFYSKRWREEGGETAKAIPNRTKHSDVAETVPQIGKRLRTTVARSEDSECSGVPAPPIREAKTKPQ